MALLGNSTLIFVATFRVHRIIIVIACSVVIPTRNDPQFLAGHLVYQSVFLINPSRPTSLQLMLQRFRLPDTIEWRTHCIPDKLIYAAQHPFVILLPVQIVTPRVLGEHDPHSSMSSRSLLAPRRAALSDSLRCFAFASLESR